MLAAIFDRFVDQSPMTVMAAGLVRRVLATARLESIFERARHSQYVNKVMFSTIFTLLSEVVTGKQHSVHAAYQSMLGEVGVSVTAVYDKLKGIETSTSQLLVRDVAEELAGVMNEMGGALPAPLPGYRLKIIDGNCLAASQHRLETLRRRAGAALPGKSLVVLDPALSLVIDVFPCEDGHTQERALFEQVLQSVQAHDLWMADRNFCVASFMVGIASAQAFFIIRDHASRPYEVNGDLCYVGEADGRRFYEQAVTITMDDGKTLYLRRLEVHLPEPTRNGDAVVVLLTNLPAEGEGAVEAIQIGSLYRGRWTIESAFQELARHLESEIDTLGYPKAALFAFAVALVAYNVMATLKAALRAAHGVEKIEQELSNYYVASELRNIWPGMMIAISMKHWDIFIEMSQQEFAQTLVQIAEHVRLGRFKKHPRGPKKHPPPRSFDPKHPHVSTARLLEQQKAERRRTT